MIERSAELQRFLDLTREAIAARARPSEPAAIAGEKIFAALARPALARLSTPTLLVWGREAANPPVESADLWLQAVQNAELEVLEGAGTLPHNEAAVAFADRLALFAEQLPAG